MRPSNYLAVLSHHWCEESHTSQRQRTPLSVPRLPMVLKSLRAALDASI